MPGSDALCIKAGHVGVPDRMGVAVLPVRFRLSFDTNAETGRSPGQTRAPGNRPKKVAGIFTLRTQYVL